MEQTIGLTIRTAADVGDQDWMPFGEVDGVRHKILWRDGSAVAGLMHLEPGAEVGAHAHEHAHHHVYVISGHGAVSGNPVEAGAYVHVPAGVTHHLAAAEGMGCTLLYLYLPV